MKTLTKLISSLAAGCFTVPMLTMIPCAAVAGDDPDGAAVEAPNPEGLGQFQIMLHRNIFDQTRVSGPTNRAAAATPRQPARQPRIETFSFRGAAETVGKGFDAFFTGDGAPTTRTVVVNDEINGFKVQSISLDEVKLMNTNEEVITLTDQTGMTRRDGGQWIKVSVPATYGSATATRRAAGNYNRQFSGRSASVTDDNAGADGGSYAGGLGATGTQAGAADPAPPSNQDMMARLQARREQENQP
jgi:hypothetical protein